MPTLYNLLYSWVGSLHLQDPIFRASSSITTTAAEQGVFKLAQCKCISLDS